MRCELVLFSTEMLLKFQSRMNTLYYYKFRTVVSNNYILFMPHLAGMDVKHYYKFKARHGMRQFDIKRKGYFALYRREILLCWQRVQASLVLMSSRFNSLYSWCQPYRECCVRLVLGLKKQFLVVLAVNSFLLVFYF